MLFNFYLTLVKTLVVFFFLLGLKLLFQLVGGYIYILDIPSRLYIQDFFIANFYYLWTLFWYLYFLFILILLYITLGCSHCVRFLFTTFIYLIVIFYILTIYYYWNLNLDYIHVGIDSEYLNKLLLNSLNRYHPLLFYFFLFSLVLHAHSSRTYSLPNPLLTYFRRRGVSSGLLCITNCLLSALFLGSWWAFQEGSWNGWWDWDPSEMFGLSIFIWGIYFLHIRTGTILTLNSHFLLLNFYYITTFLYYLIQLNFSLVSHNFSTKSVNFHNSLIILNLIVFISLIVLATLIIIYVLRVSRFIFIKYSVIKLQYCFFNKQVYRLYTFFFVLSLLIFSFLSLYPNLKFLNSYLTPEFLKSIFFFIVSFSVFFYVIYFYSPVFLPCLCLLIFLLYTTFFFQSYFISPLLLLISRFREGLVFLLHKFFIFFLCINSWVYFLNLFYWDMVGLGPEPLFNFSISNLKIDFSSYNYSLFSFYENNSSVMFSLNRWDFFAYKSLPFYNSVVYSFIKCSFNKTFSLFITDTSILPLTSCFLILIVISLGKIFFKKLIIF